MVPEKRDLEGRQRDRAFAPSSGVAIVTTCDGAGRVNAAAYGSCVRVSHEPLDIAFTAYATHDTVANLRRSRNSPSTCPGSIRTSSQGCRPSACPSPAA